MLSVDASIDQLLAEPVRVAVEHAFGEAWGDLQRAGSVVPFTIVCSEGGYDVVEHPGGTARAIYRAARDLVARALPDACVFAYDGCVDGEGGRTTRALICEVSVRATPDALVLALPYEMAGGVARVADAYRAVGTTGSLYPRMRMDRAESGIAVRC